MTLARIAELPESPICRTRGTGNLRRALPAGFPVFWRIGRARTLPRAIRRVQRASCAVLRDRCNPSAARRPRRRRKCGKNLGGKGGLLATAARWWGVGHRWRRGGSGTAAAVVVAGIRTAAATAGLRWRPRHPCGSGSGGWGWWLALAGGEDGDCRRRAGAGGGERHRRGSAAMGITGDGLMLEPDDRAARSARSGDQRL